MWSVTGDTTESIDSARAMDVSRPHPPIPGKRCSLSLAPSCEHPDTTRNHFESQLRPGRSSTAVIALAGPERSTVVYAGSGSPSRSLTRTGGELGEVPTALPCGDAAEGEPPPVGGRKPVACPAVCVGAIA